ncbi:MAG TPA: hypothetical protein VEU30_01160 [Thermoanaerobaculia bacterium]|nr:hypothetical protein [Thermoanaerobaculia bacterium]
MSTFRIATCDELWSHGRLLESRLSHGEAIGDEHGIIASDAADAQLIAIAERELAKLRDAMPHDARVRLVAEASTDGISATMTIRRGARSIVTDAEHAAADMLECGSSAAAFNATAEPPHSILWKNGTAAVLLHEAFGHPAEHGQPDIEWPSWLHIDLGLRKRRATFRDVPLTRMSHVRVTQTNAPFEVPPDAIEVTFVDGGAYDPLTEIVTLRIGDFEFRATRSEIARSLIGATGDPIRYPGVVCSREGQELVVPSFAPVMVTR